MYITCLCASCKGWATKSDSILISIKNLTIFFIHTQCVAVNPHIIVAYCDTSNEWCIS